MARNRIIKPDFWADEKIGKISPEARLLFIGMLNFCDDIGVCRGTAGFLRSQIFQFDDISLKSVESLIGELIKNNLVISKKINDESFILVKNFLKHQKIDRPSPFRFITDTTKHNVFELFNSSSDDVGTRCTLDEQYNENVNENVNENGSDDSRIVNNQKEFGFQEIVKIWNNAAEQLGLAKVKPESKMLDALVKNNKKALLTYPDEESWQRIAEAIPLQNWRLGANDRGWKADFLWLFQNHGTKKIKNYILLMEEWDNYYGGNKND